MPDTPFKWLLTAVAFVALAVFVAGAAYSRWINPSVIRELHENPSGERAQKVMILTLPSGKVLPVNYLRDDGRVFAAADFPWWRELRGGRGRASVWIKGETFEGAIRAVTDDAELRDSVFGRLRPTAPRWAGTLVSIKLD